MCVLSVYTRYTGWCGVRPVISFLASFGGMFLLDFDNFATAWGGKINIWLCVCGFGCGEVNSNEELSYMLFIVSFI